jgi:hypothetical protein
MVTSLGPVVVGICRTSGALSSVRRLPEGDCRMQRELSTTAGRLIRAIMLRDNDSFKLWRADMNLDEQAQAPLFDLIFEVFQTLVLIRFQALTEGDQIAEFVYRERLLLWPRRGFDQDKAVRLVRSALGERGRVIDVSTKEVVILRLQLITYLAEEMSLTEEQIVHLISDGERAVAGSA